VSETAAPSGLRKRGSIASWLLERTVYSSDPHGDPVAPLLEAEQQPVGNRRGAGSMLGPPGSSKQRVAAAWDEPRKYGAVDVQLLLLTDAEVRPERAVLPGRRSPMCMFRTPRRRSTGEAGRLRLGRTAGVSWGRGDCSAETVPNRSIHESARGARGFWFPI